MLLYADHVIHMCMYVNLYPMVVTIVIKYVDSIIVSLCSLMSNVEGHATANYYKETL